MQCHPFLYIKLSLAGGAFINLVMALKEMAFSGKCKQTGSKGGYGRTHNSSRRLLVEHFLRNPKWDYNRDL